LYCITAISGEAPKAGSLGKGQCQTYEEFMGSGKQYQTGKVRLYFKKKVGVSNGA
jgi:hypothetical protein